MEPYTSNHIQEMPLQSPFFRNKVESFLRANGLRMETMDVYYTLQNTDGDILAGAGLSGDVIKGVAVSQEARSEGLVAPLVSHILSQHGAGNLKVFTKPGNQAVFESLGFHVIARAPLAILMENGRGLEQYCNYLKDVLGVASAPTVGVVVMNANPFTLGHQYLLEQAAAQVDRLVIIPVKEDVSTFPYAERVAMIKAGVASVTPSIPSVTPSIPSVTPSIPSVIPSEASVSPIIVVDGSAYQISAATFPTYFLKDLSEAAETQMRLDLDLFARHIAPALGATVRFVGSEPSDPLTARYNTLMQELLPLKVVEIPRLETPVQVGGDAPSCPAPTGHLICASAVRQALEQGSYTRAAALCPESTRPYLMAALADRALRLELDTPLKPGLVGPDSNGAHKDMNYALMQKAIDAIRPYWSRMAKASVPPLLQMIGIEAEKTMKKATGGVNTHRGAIFALGLALNARGMEVSITEEVMQNRLREIAGVILHNSLINSKMLSTANSATAPRLSHGEEAVSQYGVKGAREMALEGYKALWADWLPYYRDTLGLRPRYDSEEGPRELVIPSEASVSPIQRTLLRIMSTLDDTCVIHRVGYERAQEVKREAAELLETPDQVGGDALSHPATPSCPAATGHLQELCTRYAAEGISPGGSADMLALTILIDSLTNL